MHGARLSRCRVARRCAGCPAPSPGMMSRRVESPALFGNAALRLPCPAPDSARACPDDACSCVAGALTGQGSTFSRYCARRVGRSRCAYWHWMADCCFRKSTVTDGGSHLRLVNHAFATAMLNDQRPRCSVAHRDGICNFDLKFGGRVPSVRSTHDLSCAARTRAITLNLQRVSPWRPASGLDGIRLAL